MSNGIMTPPDPWWTQKAGLQGNHGVPAIDIYQGLPYNNNDGGGNCGTLEVLTATERVTVELDMTAWLAHWSSGGFWVKIGGESFFINSPNFKETWTLSQGVHPVGFDCTIMPKENINATGTIKVYVKDSLGNILGTFLLNYIIGEGSSINFYSSKDTEIAEGNPDTNWGSSKVSYVKSSQGLNRRMLIEFPLNLPQGMTITLAKLHFMAGDTNYHPREQLFSRIISDWDELATTWNNQPAITPLHATTVVAPDIDGGGYMEFDVTQLAKDALLEGKSNIGIQIRYLEESKTDFFPNMFYVTREHEMTQWRPYLEIQYTEGNTVTLKSTSVTVLVTINEVQAGTTPLSRTLTPNSSHTFEVPETI